MRTVTLSVDEELLARATEVIARRATTLDQVFERALRELADSDVAPAAVAYDELMQRLSYANSGGRFSREEMNER